MFEAVMSAATTDTTPIPISMPDILSGSHRRERRIQVGADIETVLFVTRDRAQGKAEDRPRKVRVQ